MLTRKDTISLVIIILLLIGIPVITTLLRQQQILRSRASINPIVFTGNNVKTVVDAAGNRKVIATNRNVELQLVSTLGTDVVAPTPTPVPTSSATPTPGSTDNNAPDGFLVYGPNTFGSSSCSASTGFVAGWACDKDKPDATLSVDIFEKTSTGNVYLGTAQTNDASVHPEQAVNTRCGGGTVHGFKFNLPQSIRDGQQHTIFAYGININNQGERVDNGGANNAVRHSKLNTVPENNNNEITLTCSGGSTGGGTTTDSGIVPSNLASGSFAATPERSARGLGGTDAANPSQVVGKRFKLEGSVTGPSGAFLDVVEWKTENGQSTWLRSHAPNEEFTVGSDASFIQVGVGITPASSASGTVNWSGVKLMEVK